MPAIRRKCCTRKVVRQMVRNIGFALASARGSTGSAPPRKWRISERQLGASSALLPAVVRKPEAIILQ